MLVCEGVEAEFMSDEMESPDTDECRCDGAAATGRAGVALCGRGIVDSSIVGAGTTVGCAGCAGRGACVDCGAAVPPLAVRAVAGETFAPAAGVMPSGSGGRG